MTIEEFDRIALKLDGMDLINFINKNLEVANEWTERELEKVRHIDAHLDEATSREIWNGIVEMIRQREQRLKSKYFVCFKNIIMLK